MGSVYTSPLPLIRTNIRTDATIQFGKYQRVNMFGCVPNKITSNHPVLLQKHHPTRIIRLV